MSTTQQPTAGAMRAAEAILQHAQQTMGDHSRTPDDVFAKLVEIIDRESGARELLDRLESAAAIIDELDAANGELPIIRAAIAGCKRFAGSSGG